MVLHGFRGYQEFKRNCSHRGVSERFQGITESSLDSIRFQQGLNKVYVVLMGGGSKKSQSIIRRLECVQRVSGRIRCMMVVSGVLKTFQGFSKRLEGLKAYH